MDEHKPSGDRALRARRSLNDDFGRSRRSELAGEGIAAKPNETPRSEARTVVKPSQKSRGASMKTSNEVRKFHRNVRIVVKQCEAVDESTDIAAIERLLGKISVIFEEADTLEIPEKNLEQVEEFYAILDTRMFALRKENLEARDVTRPSVREPAERKSSDASPDPPAAIYEKGDEARTSKRSKTMCLSEIDRDRFGWETAGDGVRLRDEIKLEAGLYALAARSAPVRQIDTGLSVFVAGLRAKLGKITLRLGNFRSSSRFKFAKAYVKHAKRVANLVHENAKGDTVDACFFLLMPSVGEAIGHEKSALIRGMGGIDSNEDFEQYVFMSGKFAAEDKPGDPDDALETIRKVSFEASDGALTAVAHYFQAVAEKIAEKNCVVKMEKLAAAITTTIGKLDKQLASKIRAEYAGLTKQAKTLQALRRITLKECERFEDTSDLFDARSARAAIGSADIKKEVPPKIRSFIKKLIESPVKGCWFCKKEGCRRKRRGSEEVCPQCPKFVKDFGIPNLVRLWRKQRATGKVARTPLTGKTEYAGVASISGTAVPAIWDSGVTGKKLDAIAPFTLFKELKKGKRKYDVVTKDMRIVMASGQSEPLECVIRTSLVISLPEVGGRGVTIQGVLVGILRERPEESEAMEILIGRNVGRCLGIPTMEDTFNAEYSKIDGTTTRMDDRCRVDSDPRGGRATAKRGAALCPEVMIGVPENPTRVGAVFDPLTIGAVVSSPAARRLGLRYTRKNRKSRPRVLKRSPNAGLVAGCAVVGETDTAVDLLVERDGSATVSRATFQVVDHPQEFSILGQEHLEDDDGKTPGIGTEFEATEDDEIFEKLADSRVANLEREGFPAAAVKRFRDILDRFRNVWREDFRPGDPPAKVPPMELNLRKKAEWPDKPAIRHRTVSVEEERHLRSTLDRFIEAGVVQEVRFCGAQEMRRIRRGKKRFILADIRDVACHQMLLVKKRLKSRKVQLIGGMRSQAPMWEYRIVVCLDRWLNRVTRQTPLPPVDYDRIWARLTGKTVFGSFDFIHAYFQFALAQKHRTLCSFAALGRIFCLCRLPQGAMNSGHQMQSALHSMFADMIDKGMALQADDGIFYAGPQDGLPDWEVLAQTWERALSVMVEFNLKVKLSKVVLCTRALSWCGRRVSQEGVSIDPDRTRAVTEMPCPERLSELMQFVHAGAWSRKFIPSGPYQETFGRLRRFLDDQLKGTDRTKRAASKRLLKTCGWNQTWREVFDAAKQTLKEAIERPRAFYNPEKTVHVFTDASDTYWGAAVYQGAAEITPGELDPLAFYSGAFRGSERNYTIPEKEGLAVIRTFEKAKFFLGRHFVLHCDAKNLVYVYLAPHVT